MPVTLGAGWVPLRDELEEALRRLDPPGELLDVYLDASGLPKFRVRVDPKVKAEGRNLVREYESRAIEVCEACGESGHVRAGVILTTRCDHC